MELVRYIHLSPLRAKVVRGLEGLEEYAYSGQNALMGRVERPCQDTGYVRGMIGRNEEGLHREFVEGGIRGSQKPELEELSRRMRMRREGWTMERVAGSAAEVCSVEIDAIYRGSKVAAASRVRSLCSYWAVKELGMSAAEVASDLWVTRQGVASDLGVTRQGVASDLGVTRQGVASDLGMTRQGAGLAARRGEEVVHVEGVGLADAQ